MRATTTARSSSPSNSPATPSTTTSPARSPGTSGSTRRSPSAVRPCDGLRIGPPADSILVIPSEVRDLLFPSGHSVPAHSPIGRSDNLVSSSSQFQNGNLIPAHSLVLTFYTTYAKLFHVRPRKSANSFPCHTSAVFAPSPHPSTVPAIENSGVSSPDRSLTLFFTVAKSFVCHTSEKCAGKSFSCHTFSKKMLCPLRLPVRCRPPTPTHHSPLVLVQCAGHQGCLP